MRITFICILLFLVPQFQATEPDQVIEFFRHGARAPNHAYDPQWPASELGLLTTVGMVQQYKLGKDLAAKYPNLIASGYNPDDVYALTNDVERCIESALVQLSSMFRGLTSTLTTSPQQSLIDSLIAEYTPSLDAGESSRGNYVPIQVDVVTSGTEENLIFDGRTADFCPNLATYIAENKLSTEMSQGWTTFQPPIQEANTYLSGNQVIKSLRGLYTAYDSFYADYIDGKTLPGGISDWDLLDRLSYGSAYYLFANEQLQKTQTQLTAYPTLKAVKDQLYNFRQGKNAKKLVLLSGHDKNIFAVLSSFGVLTGDCLVGNYQDLENSLTPSDTNCHFPGFASTLIFEFYNTTSNPYVKVYYDNDIVPLCNGQDTCSYEDFVAFLDSTTEIDSINTWNRKCGNPYDPETPSVISSDSNGLSTGAIIGIVVGGAAACILVGVGAWILLKKKALIKLKPTVDVRAKQTELPELSA